MILIDASIAAPENKLALPLLKLFIIGRRYSAAGITSRALIKAGGALTWPELAAGGNIMFDARAPKGKNERAHAADRRAAALHLNCSRARL